LTELNHKNVIETKLDLDRPHGGGRSVSYFFVWNVDRGSGIGCKKLASTAANSAASDFSSHQPSLQTGGPRAAGQGIGLIVIENAYDTLIVTSNVRHRL
jgi:hypothetical protein